MKFDWNQHEGFRGRFRESDTAYQRFREYLEQGSRRSLLAIARTNGVSKQAVCGMATKFNWRSRAAAWDKHQRQREREGKKAAASNPPRLPPQPAEPPPNPSEQPFRQWSAEHQAATGGEQPESSPGEHEAASAAPSAPTSEAATAAPPGSPPPPPPPRPPAPGSEPEPDLPVEPQVVGNLRRRNKDEEYLKGLEQFRDIYGKLGYSMALESFNLFPTIQDLREDIVLVMRNRKAAIQTNDAQVVAILSDVINKQIPQYGKLCEAMINLANAGRQHWGAVVGIEELLEEAYGKPGRKAG